MRLMSAVRKTWGTPERSWCVAPCPEWAPPRVGVCLRGVVANPGAQQPGVARVNAPHEGAPWRRVIRSMKVGVSV